VTLADLAADVRALTPSEAAERVVPSTEELTARLSALQRRTAALLRAQATACRRHVEQLGKSRVLRNPQSLIYDRIRRVDEFEALVQRAIRRRCAALRDRLASIACRAEALSPLAVLARGYSVATRAATGETLCNARDITPGELINTRLRLGQVISRVERTTLDSLPIHPPLDDNSGCPVDTSHQRCDHE
jgi:exodeoxyribonuclease VII large subunit